METDEQIDANELAIFVNIRFHSAQQLEQIHVFLIEPKI